MVSLESMVVMVSADSPASALASASASTSSIFSDSRRTTSGFCSWYEGDGVRKGNLIG